MLRSNFPSKSHPRSQFLILRATNSRPTPWIEPSNRKTITGAGKSLFAGEFCLIRSTVWLTNKYLLCLVRLRSIIWRHSLCWKSHLSTIPSSFSRYSETDSLLMFHWSSKGNQSELTKFCWLKLVQFCMLNCCCIRIRICWNLINYSLKLLKKWSISFMTTRSRTWKRMQNRFSLLQNWWVLMHILPFNLKIYWRK